MALFKTKLTLDEILKGVENLSDEDKAKVKAKMDDLYKAEDEREIDKIEEEKSDDEEVKDDKKDDVDEESEEIGKDVDEVEEEIEEDEDDTEETEESEESEETEDKDEWKTTIESRLNALEEAMKGYARNPKKADDEVSSKLESLAKKYE